MRCDLCDSTSDSRSQMTNRLFDPHIYHHHNVQYIYHFYLWNFYTNSLCRLNLDLKINYTRSLYMLCAIPYRIIEARSQLYMDSGKLMFRSCTSRPGQFFTHVIRNSILNFNNMFLDQFCMLNSILESILNDSEHKIKNLRNSHFDENFI